ncbi:DUF6920 family protein [Rubrivivax sp. RP6-9]|uniref:DUF6920 family protein n=1 Tax=Rubrivivax sp. RP6-9 TaxID=3415750 RepID=UPI003CC615B5
MWIKWVAVVTAVLLAIFAVLAAFGVWRWNAGTRGLMERLEAARCDTPHARFDAERDLVGLPPVVQRFFRAALADGTPFVAAASLEHRGTFNLAAEGPDRWIPFTSTQRVTTRRPGFVWNARMTIAPGLTVRVHDAYVAGEGILHPALLGLVSLTELRGTTPELGGVAHGEFMRFVAEATWYPTALLPSQGARWTAVDEQSARVDLADGRVVTSLLLAFHPSTGLIDSVRAEARGRTVGQAVVMTPWEGRWSDYAELGPVNTTAGRQRSARS